MKKPKKKVVAYVIRAGVIKGHGHYWNDLTKRWVPRQRDGSYYFVSYDFPGSAEKEVKKDNDKLKGRIVKVVTKKPWKKRALEAEKELAEIKHVIQERIDILRSSGLEKFVMDDVEEVAGSLGPVSPVAAPVRFVPRMQWSIDGRNHE